MCYFSFFTFWRSPFFPVCFTSSLLALRLRCRTQRTTSWPSMSLAFALTATRRTSLSHLVHQGFQTFILEVQMQISQALPLILAAPFLGQLASLPLVFCCCLFQPPISYHLSWIRSSFNLLISIRVSLILASCLLLKGSTFSPLVFIPFLREPFLAFCPLIYQPF